MVDSGSSASLVTEQMAWEIEVRDINSWWRKNTNPTQLRSYTNDPIINKGTLYSDIQCNGWYAGRADLIMVPNNHRTIIGRDLFQALGITLQQHSSSSPEGKSILIISTTSTCPLKQEIAIKYKKSDFKNRPLDSSYSKIEIQNKLYPHTPKESTHTITPRKPGKRRIEKTTTKWPYHKIKQL